VVSANALFSFCGSGRGVYIHRNRVNARTCRNIVFCVFLDVLANRTLAVEKRRSANLLAIDNNNAHYCNNRKHCLLIYTGLNGVDLYGYISGDARARELDGHAHFKAHCIFNDASEIRKDEGETQNRRTATSDRRLPRRRRFLTWH